MADNIHVPTPEEVDLARVGLVRLTLDLDEIRMLGWLIDQRVLELRDDPKADRPRQLYVRIQAKINKAMS